MLFTVSTTRRVLNCSNQRATTTSQRARCCQRRSRQLRATSATRGSVLPDDVKAALHKCGAASTAAYTLYKNQHKLCDNIQGQDMRALLAQLDKTNKTSYEQLHDFKGMALMWGYPGLGSVLENPRPLEKGAGPVHTCVGFIAERTTGTDNTPELLIAFRGTQTGSDWVTNALGAKPEFDLYPGALGSVHRGFYNLLHGIPEGGSEDRLPTQAIDQVLQTYVTEHKPLPRCILTGHSLGGALAVLAAAYIRTRYLPVPADSESPVLSQDYTQRQLQVYTFAAPRVGNSGLQQTFLNVLLCPAVQLKNRRDVVPYLLPNDWPECLATLGHVLLRIRPRNNNSVDGLESDDWQAVYAILQGCSSIEEAVQKLEKQQGLSLAMPLAQARGRHQRIALVLQLLRSIKLVGDWTDNAAPQSCGTATFASGFLRGAHSLQLYIEHIDKATLL